MNGNKMIIYKKTYHDCCGIYCGNTGKTVYSSSGYLYYLKRKYWFFGPKVEKIFFRVIKTKDTGEEARRCVEKILDEHMKALESYQPELKDNFFNKLRYYMKKKKKYKGYIDPNTIFISDEVAKKIINTKYETV